MPEDPPKPPDPPAKTFTQAELDDKIGERLKRETAKYSDYEELKAKAAKLDDAEEKNKTESQKLLDRIAAVEKRAEDAEKKVTESDARALRLEVAAAKGLSPTQAKRLVGATRDELESDADDLLENFKPGGNGDGKGAGKGTAPPGGRPAENLRGGSDPEEDPAPNVADIVKAIPRI